MNGQSPSWRRIISQFRQTSAASAATNRQKPKPSTKAMSACSGSNCPAYRLHYETKSWNQTPSTRARLQNTTWRDASHSITISRQSTAGQYFRINDLHQTTWLPFRCLRHLFLCSAYHAMLRYPRRTNISNRYSIGRSVFCETKSFLLPLIKDLCLFV